MRSLDEDGRYGAPKSAESALESLLSPAVNAARSTTGISAFLFLRDADYYHDVGDVRADAADVLIDTCANDTNGALTFCGSGLIRRPRTSSYTHARETSALRKYTKVRGALGVIVGWK